MNWISENCDGAGPHAGHEVRRYPLGGGENLILCAACAARENHFRFERKWPQIDYFAQPVYAQEVK